MYDVLLHIARGGENIGSWPVDIVAALRRSGVLLPGDLYTLDGFEDWKPLAELLPEQPLNLPTPIHGADDVDVRWGYFCRDGHVIEGPRPMDEIDALCEAKYLKDEHKFFVIGEGKWHTVGEWNSQQAAFSSLAEHPANALSMAHPGFGWALRFGARLVDGFLAGDEPSHVDQNPFTVAHRLKYPKVSEPTKPVSVTPVKPEAQEITSDRVYVGNLNFDTNEDDLRQVFCKCGKVVAVEVVRHKHTQRSKGFGFVQMQTIDEAKSAVEELHFKEFMGRNIVVSGAKRAD